MHSRLLFLSLTIALASGAFLGCTSGNDIPDDYPVEYRSTSDDVSFDANGEGNDSDTGLNNEGLESADLRAIGPVATVNGQEISADAFNEQAADYRSVSVNVPPESRPQLKEYFTQEILENLIGRALIENAIADADIVIDDAALDERIQQFAQEFSEAQPDMEFEEYLSYQGLTPELFREVMAETLAIERLLETRGHSRPSDADVRAFYESNPERFFQEESVDVSLIFIQDPAHGDDTRQEAQAIKDSIEGGELSFEEAMAQNDSQDYPGLGRGDLPPQFEEFTRTVFDLSPGDVSDPIATPDGWHIVRVNERHDERQIPFDEVQDTLAEELYYLALHEGLDDLMAELRNQAEIEIHEENII